jgi:hypothetical protein
VKLPDAQMAPPIVHQVLNSPGKPLDAEIRRSMEPRFGHDFGHVRVHTGAQAAASAQAVNARAYATGSNIVFADGQFSPGTKAGQQLLAHELAHTLQQKNTASSASGLPITDPEGRSEREADHAAQAVSTGRQATVTPAAAGVARQPAGAEAKEAPAAPTNLEQLERALTKFFKDVARAFPKDWLPSHQRVITQAVKLAGVSRAPYRGPVKTLDPKEVQARMEEFLRGGSAPNDAEKLAKAVVQLLPGPVPPAAIDEVKAQNVFRPAQPGILDRYGAGAPADLPPGNPQDVLDQQRQSSAESSQKTSPKTSPPLDPYRVGKAIKGGREPLKDEYTNPPVVKPDEPYRPGVVNRDIKIASILPALTADRPIRFQVNLPGAPASDDKALRASLTPGGVTDLQGVVGWLQRGPEFDVQLTGMASIEGPTEHNTKLGENRVRSIANALVRAGIAGDRIADVPGRPEACPRLSFGIYNCGDSQAAKPADANDRRVQARLFVRQKSTKP